MGFLDWAASHRILVRRIFASIPEFAIAGFFATAWLAPSAFGTNVFARCAQIMLMEFIIIHSSAFLGIAMTSPSRRIMRVLSVVGLGLLYSLFVGAFALEFQNVWLLVSFWILLLNRTLSIILGPTPNEGDLDFIMVGWATAFVCYLRYIFLTSLANIPRLGITAAAVATQPIPTGGIWADAPWRVTAFGTLYYSTMGIADLLGLGMPSENRERRKHLRRRSLSSRRIGDGRDTTSAGAGLR